VVVADVVEELVDAAEVVVADEDEPPTVTVRTLDGFPPSEV
jgi:hypothetical protein